jgi:uncharacterized protein
VVRKGEYLERAVVIPGEESALDGLYHRGEQRPPVLIVPPHPEEGAMESPIIAELAWAVTRAGHPTLRFNWRGVGASTGVYSDDDGERARDLATAIAHLRASVRDGEQTAIAICGVRYGASIAARYLSSMPGAIELLVLVSPDPARLSEDLARTETEVLIVAGEREAAPHRQALRAVAEQGRRTRLAVIPQADQTFLRGLVELGRVVAEAVSPPPGLIDLG